MQHRSTLPTMELPDLALLGLSTARLTRLVTTDDLGEWLVREPLELAAAYRYEEGVRLGLLYLYPGGADPNEVPPDDVVGWGLKLAKGLKCPFCVGYWIGAANLAAYLLSGRYPLLRKGWRAVAGSLALNYVTAHASARLDS